MLIVRSRGLVVFASLCLVAVYLMPTAVAAACEGALEDKSTEKGEFEEGALYEQLLEYQQNGGPATTGNLVEIAEGPFEMVGNCGGKALGNKGQCTVKVKCKKLGEGKVKVEGTEAGIRWWSQKLKC